MGAGRGRGEPWEIDPAEIKIMQRSDGGPWVLGEGASGSVSLPLQMTFRHQAYSRVAAIRSVYRALGARSRIAVPASVVVAKVHHERPRCIWKFLTYRLCKAVMQRFIPADPVSDVGQRQTAKAMQIPVLTISFGAQVYKAQWRVQTVAVKMLSNTTEKQMEGFKREALILEDLKDTNIVQFMGACFEDSGDSMLVTEFMAGGNLFDAIGNDRDGKLGWYQR